MKINYLIFMFMIFLVGQSCYAGPFSQWPSFFQKFAASKSEQPKVEKQNSKWFSIGINQNDIDKIANKLENVPVEAAKKMVNDPDVQKYIQNNKLAKGVSFVADYMNGTPEQRVVMTKNFIENSNDMLKVAKTEFKNQGMDKTVESWWDIFSPSQWYLARNGFIFGAAVFAGFNGLYFAQQALRDYLALRRPKYISPLSSLGMFDRSKKLAQRLIYGLVKRKKDATIAKLVDEFKNDMAEKLTLKKGGAVCVHNASYKNSTHIFASVAEQLGMDFIAVSAIHLLDEKIGVELWNDIVQLIHKNQYKVMLYIDQAELLSMDGTEYSKREDNVRIFVSCLHSAIPSIGSKCLLIGAMNGQDALQGPFAHILTKHLNV